LMRTYAKRDGQASAELIEALMQYFETHDDPPAAAGF